MLVLRAILGLMIMGATYFGFIELAVFIFEKKKLHQKPRKKLLNIKSIV